MQRRNRVDLVTQPTATNVWSHIGPTVRRLSRLVARARPANLAGFGPVNEMKSAIRHITMTEKRRVVAMGKGFSDRRKGRA
jgi:hypothetical protein